MKEEHDDKRDLFALYERGEISAEDLAEEMNESSELKPYRNDDEDIYLSLNVQEKTDTTVRFKVGIQMLYGMELMGFNIFTTRKGKRTRHGSSCRYRSINGVTLVSMCHVPEWCPGGFYYALPKRDDLGVTEEDLGKGVFLMDKTQKEKNELMDAKTAQRIRDYYASMTGSSKYDKEVHNQMVRGLTLKIMGPDQKNGEVTVSVDDFEKIEFAVRAYNKHMNDNSDPGEFARHVAKMISSTRQLPAASE